MLREHGDKAKSIWTHLVDSASEWPSLLGWRFLPLASPASAGFFRTPALPKLNRSPSEAPVSQSNCRLLIVDGRHLLRIIFVLLQLNLAWRRMRCYGELSRGAACSCLCWRPTLVLTQRSRGDGSQAMARLHDLPGGPSDGSRREQGILNAQLRDYTEYTQRVRYQGGAWPRGAKLGVRA